jgi:DNA gyrase inhibitor GyrI
MRVASARAFGPSPELDAWQKLEAWARPRGLFEPDVARIYGFNNPSPSAGSPNYGYEFWITVGPEVEPEGEIRIVEFSGGLYAVAPLAVEDPARDIPPAWQRLNAWVHANGYREAPHQWLEEHSPTGAGNLVALYHAVQE